MKPPRGAGRGTGQPGAKKLRTARGRKASSRRWLERQLNDPYVARSQREGYRSRAAYKLLEIDERYNLLKPGDRVVDLGAAPGGWSQIAAERVRSHDPEPRVVAIDYLPMEPMPGVTVLQMDLLDEAAPAAIMEALGGPPDVVLSDMAAPTTGHRATDHLRTMALCEAAADFARQALAPGGRFLAKVFRGGTEHTLLAELKRDFGRIHHVKPPASRAESPELYLLATDFRGGKVAPRGSDLSPLGGAQPRPEDLEEQGKP